MTLSVTDLPFANAVLNGSCAALLAVGFLQVRAGRRRAHALCMTAALLVSLAFLASYLVYHSQVGSVRYQGTGPSRTVYLTILLTHSFLAAANVPLVLVTLARALKGRFEAHRRVARFALPVWGYVSVTGVVIYWMLYGA